MHLNLVKVSPQELYDSVAHLVAEGRRVGFAVNSGSMRPFLREGRQVELAEPCGIAVGDVVLARCDDGSVVLHAVEHIDGNRLTLAGTANLHKREHCLAEDVAAKMVRPPALLRLWPRSPFLRRLLLKALPK